MYDVGDVVELRFDTVAGGSFVTPTTVVLALDLPDGTTASLTPTAATAGRYLASYVSVQSGRHVARWVATGPGARADADIFHVTAGSLALCSLAGAKRHLNMTTDVDDEELREYLEAATGVIERHRNEILARRTLTATVYGGELLPQSPVISVTSAVPAAGGVPLVVSGAEWLPDPVTGLLVVPRGSPQVVVTFVAGLRSIPGYIVLAAEIITSHLWETQRPQAAGPTSGFTSVDVMTPAGRGYAIPTRAIELLGGRAPLPA